MSDYCPGATQVPQSNGGDLNTALPPRAVWHITWDRLDSAGNRPAFSAVAGYLRNVGYCPHIMWDPFTGYMEQYYPASQSARALVAWNQDGAACVQVEVLFSPGCVVDGVTYATVADTPCVGLSTLLSWMDSLGIPRTWPMGPPQWQGNSRDPDIWNSSAGHYGHCNVPDNTHTDPGPMPDITGTLAPAGGVITEGFLMALSDEEQKRVLAAADRINGVITDEHAKVLTTDDLPAIGKAVVETEFPWYGFDGKTPANGRQTTTLKIQQGWADTNTAGLQAAVVGLTEIVKQLSFKQGVVIDYDAIAKAVNDDAAKRLAG